MYAEKHCSQGFKSLLLVGPCEDVLVQDAFKADDDQRDDHPTDERRVCSGLSPSPCASASLMLQ